jgi:hypothetical protein
MLKELACIAATATVCASSAFAQAVSSADVNIVSITAQNTTQNFVCTIEINNQNDDDAYDTHVIVLLPLQTEKVSSMKVSGGPGFCVAKPFPGSSGFVEFANCSLGHLPQGFAVRRTVTITASPSTAAPVYRRQCSAFIFSRVGDIDQSNNYMTATAP